MSVIDFKHGVVSLNHGSGGRAMFQLIESLFMKAFANPLLATRNDSACLDMPPGRMVVSTDAHVISPLFFPGGDIGCLSVHGTINDLAVSGAKPLYLTASFILEEGFALADLQRIVISMAKAAEKAGVRIIAGDTKVVERGKADGVFITTTGIGWLPEGSGLSGDIKPGDKVLVSGFMGDHGVAIMAHRNHLRFATSMQSDTTALHDLTQIMMEAAPNLRCMRDPTRGGLATVLNEWAHQHQVGFLIHEAQIPVRREVASACELLGLDVLYVANEGKLVAICPAEQADTLLAAMKRHPKGQNAAIIGEVVADDRALVSLRTHLGSSRLVDWLHAEQLPRIC